MMSKLRSLVNIINRKSKDAGRGGFNSTLRRLNAIIIILIAASTSPFKQTTLLASSSQEKDGLSIEFNKFNKEIINVQLIKNYILNSPEVTIEALLSDISKDRDYKELKKLKIIGKARVITSFKKGSYIGQVVWTHVTLKQKEKEHTQSLHKPLTSSFKLRSPHLKAKSTLKAQGNIQAFVQDIQKLFKKASAKNIKSKEVDNSDNDEEIEQPQTILNTERRVDDTHSILRGKQGHHKDGLGSAEEDLADGSLTSPDSFSPLKSLSYGSPSNAKTSSSGTVGNAPGSKFGSSASQTGDNSSQFLTSGGSSSGLRTANRHTGLSPNLAASSIGQGSSLNSVLGAAQGQPGTLSGGNQGMDPGMSRLGQASAQSGHLLNETGQGFGQSSLGNSLSHNPGHGAQNMQSSHSPQSSQFEPGDGSNHGTLFSGDGLSVSAFPNSKGSLELGLSRGDDIDAEGSSRFGSHSSRSSKSSEEQITLPNIEIKLTQEGCKPRVDFTQGRVIIQSRSQTFKDGVMIKESSCSDTFESYPIKKDYNCGDSTEYVDYDNRVAYSRFKYYWQDADANRHEISSHLEIDQTRPYPFIEDPGVCPPEIDIQNKVAYRQAETVYYNRTNGRVKVHGCHRIEGSQPILLHLTTQGCTPIHDFVAGTSRERKRLLFQIDGIEHEALSCHEVGDPIPHEFVTSVCKPLEDLSNNLITPMTRRRITTSQGQMFITEECEPYGQSIALKLTTQGCEGKYHHAFDAGRSYLKKRWYHTLSGSCTYLTECLPSTKYLSHQMTITGYKHDDNAKVSYPKTSISIVPSQGQPIEISRPQVRGKNNGISYVFVKESLKPSLMREIEIEGCHRVTPVDKVHLYRRGDNSLYEIIVGEGTSIKGPDECQRIPETAKMQEYLVLLFYCYTPTMTMAKKSEEIFEDLASARKYSYTSPYRWIRVRTVTKTRTKITTPLGKTTYTDWQQTGLLSQWATVEGYCPQNLRAHYN